MIQMDILHKNRLGFHKHFYTKRCKAQRRRFLLRQRNPFLPPQKTATADWIAENAGFELPFTSVMPHALSYGYLLSSFDAQESRPVSAPIRSDQRLDIDYIEDNAGEHDTRKPQQNMPVFKIVVHEQSKDAYGAYSQHYAEQDILPEYVVNQYAQYIRVHDFQSESRYPMLNKAPRKRD